MPDVLKDKVRSATNLHEGYRRHAAPENMDAYLTDWVQAHGWIPRIGGQWPLRRRDGEHPQALPRPVGC